MLFHNFCFRLPLETHYCQYPQCRMITKPVLCLSLFKMFSKSKNLLFVLCFFAACVTNIFHLLQVPICNI